MDRLDEALWVAENGQKIFIEAGAGVYTVSQGDSSHYVSGKNVSLVGASTKYCALLYQNTKTPAPALVSPNIVKIEVSKYFVRKYLAMI